MMGCVRGEYPRPDFVREQWLNLNGTWRFDFDDDDVGLSKRWFDNPAALKKTIQVPFAYQAPASGIGDTAHHPVVWYAREVTIPESWRGKRIRLNFGAVDYEAAVWVNGIPAGFHQGGYVPFGLDVTPMLRDGSNWVVVRAVDQVRTDQPRGKQTARTGSWACWYTAVTGIWQTVWMEPVDQVHVSDVRLVPDIDGKRLSIGLTLSQVTEGLVLEVVATAEGREISRAEVAVRPTYKRWSDIWPEPSFVVSLPVPGCRLWSPEDPFVYDLSLRLRTGERVVDDVRTYFGMRKVESRGGEIYLNNRPYYQRLVLDQGYWPEGLYTAPSAEAIRRDVELTKAMGFNGARKHQKIEDPYYYYYCDTLGLLTWVEMPSCYAYNEGGADRLRREWAEVVLRHRNHPSVIAWVLMNESWGVDEFEQGSCRGAVAHVMALYYETYALDGTRLVVDNDGWQHAKTDMLTIHEYTQSAEDLRIRLARFFADPKAAVFSHGFPAVLPGFDGGDVPVLVTEFGGTKVARPGSAGWGYGEEAAGFDELLARIGSLVDAILECPGVVGYCYTQLTDVEQEVNGLLTHGRDPKVPVERLREVFRGR